jgi:ABC-2 type transport system ATP-binding protein
MKTPTDSLAVDLHNVAKTYKRKVHALRGIEMQVHPGEIFGLLGPNGAGKSTLVKVMMTVVRPTHAGGTILGKPIGHKPTLSEIGYLPENHRFPPYLTGRQALEYYAALSGVRRQARKARAREMLAMVDLSDWANAKVRTYSKGMQQRLGLAQAFMNDPTLVVLDEPTDGLDPVGRRKILEVLMTFRDSGKTIFLNSHLLGEVERVCDRLAILVQGEVVRQGTVDDLTSKGQRYEIRVHDEGRTDLTQAIRAAVRCELNQTPPEPGGGGPPPLPVQTGALPTGHRVELEGNLLRIATDDAVDVQPVIDALRGQKLVIHSVNPVRKSLEDFFIETVSDSTPGAALPGTDKEVRI